MSEKLPALERIRIAKEKMSRVVDHVLYLLALHKSNAIVVYSQVLASQIPTSYAANAFNVFQRALHHFEIVRLCALWDSADLYKENVPTIVELIDNTDVIEGLVRETLSHWQGTETHLCNPSDDPELSAIEIESIRAHEQQFANEQANKARMELLEAIRLARDLLNSPRLAGIMNLRDKHLAHSLARTRREQKTGSVAPMKYGDEREILLASLPIIQALYCWVNGTSFDFENSCGIAEKNAEALWNGCTFNVLR